MKAVPEETIAEFESVALEAVKQIRAYFKYEGANPLYFQRAKVAASAISAYTRLRASESNRMAVELMAERADAEYARKQVGPGPKRLKA